MKHFLKIFFILLILNNTVFASKSGEAVKEMKTSEHQLACSSKEKSLEYTQNLDESSGDFWGVFWINFAIASIGMYSIYGFAAGIISAGLSYFIVNGNKKGFRMAILGAALGIIIGLAARLFVLFLI